MLLVRTHSDKASSTVAKAQTALITLLLRERHIAWTEDQASTRVSQGQYVETMFPLPDDVEANADTVRRLFELMRDSFPNSKVIVGDYETR